MNKLLVGILVGLAVIAGLLINLTRVVQGPPQQFGARPDASVRRIASTTPDAQGTYFGLLLPVADSETRTATATLLTAQGIIQTDAVSIAVVNVSTTTTGGTVFIQPEVSLDASTWFPVAFGEVTNTGPLSDRVTLSSGTASTTFSWIPNRIGTSTVLLPPLKNLAVDWLRVKVWSTSTSTITVGIHNLNQ